MAKKLDTIYVGCRIPTGITCNVPYDSKLYFERLRKGDRVDNLPGEKIVIKGCNTSQQVIQTGVLSGSYGITELKGKQADGFLSWISSNKENPLVKNHLVWVCNSRIDAGKEGKNLSKSDTGLEGIDPKKEEKQRDRNNNIQRASQMTHNEVESVAGVNG